MALMLYARYGRIGVEMLQAVFRDLAKRLTTDGTPGYRVTKVYPGTIASAAVV